MVGHRSRWKTKNVLKKPFKKELKLDDIQVNIKEEENTNQKIQHNKWCPLSFQMHTLIRKGKKILPRRADYVVQIYKAYM